MGTMAQSKQQAQEEGNMTAENNERHVSVTCTFCTWKERLQSFYQLEAGSHICLGGEKLKSNFRKKQIALYTHHAIVKEVNALSSSTGILTLIHFNSTSFDSTNKIRETVELKDLLYDEIYIVHYRHPVNPPEKILQQAQLLLEKSNTKTYNVLTRNCEHFCNLCCAGSQESHQVHDRMKAIISKLFKSAGYIPEKIVKIVQKLKLRSIDNISKIIEVAVPYAVLAVGAVAEFIYCVYMHIHYNKRLKKGTMCSSCCSNMKTNMWLSFGTCYVLQGGGLALVTLLTTVVASKLVLLGLPVLIGSISLALIVGISKIRSKLAAPFQGKFLRKKTIKDIWPGDVVKVSYTMSSFYGIVSYAKASRDCESKGKIKLIYYKKHAVGRSVIVEEEAVYDLKNVKIEQLDYVNHKCHDARSVIRRARKRLGEKKYCLITNRSCHFCHWAKVNEDALQDVPMDDFQPTFKRSIRFGESTKLPSLERDHRRSRKHATKTMEHCWAVIRDDVTPGQIISLGYWGSKAICTDVAYSDDAQSKLSVSIVHVGKNGNVCEETIEVDLNEKDIWIYRYHQLCRYSTDQVIERARQRVKQGGSRSNHLVAEIVEKHMDESVVDLQNIKPGDVIRFCYWSFKHAAVVSGVQLDERKENTTEKVLTGSVTVIHYALDGIFATHHIKEEQVRFDLEKDYVYLKKYGGFVTYPPDRVVQRARSRIGEQRFSIFGNTSIDFVHWSKVIQTVSLVEVLDTQVALKPLVGARRRSDFQSVYVYSWLQLKPGSIISFNYYFFKWHKGIVTMVNEERKEIEVIYYGRRNIFATRTVMEDTLQCDLSTKQVMLYSCDPYECKKTEDIIAGARSKLGRTDLKSGWNFCVECIRREKKEKC